MQIEENIKLIRHKLPDNVRLVAVSKTKPNEDILAAYSVGQRIFGENKVQDLTKKYEELPKDIEWHFIGHLQSNKVKYIAPFISMIHAVDSIKLLKTISKEAIKNKRTIDYMLQLHVAEENTKFGLSEQELYEIIRSPEFQNMKNVNLRGIMAMASNTKDQNQVKNEFARVKNIFDNLKTNFFASKSDFNEISTGMSSDFELAIEQGSTLVRIGSTIFGARNY